jgi:steroid delta-isomerase-like uncharacterized protein
VKPVVVDLMDRWEAAWSGRDQHAFREVCAPDVFYEDPVAQHPLDGPEAIGMHARSLWQLFPDARMDRSGERLGDGRYLVAPFRLTGTHTGDADNLPASGRTVRLHGVCYCELDPPRERLWRVRVFFDRYDAAVQLGVLPQPGGVAEKAMLMARGFGLRLGRR